jgi:hypothetical protein
MDDNLTWSTALTNLIYDASQDITLKFIVIRSTPALDGQTASYGPVANLNNRWIHLAGTVDSNGISLYLNGQQVARTDVTITTLRASENVFCVGKSTVISPSYAYFHLAEARIYGRALSPGEIWELYDPRTRNELYQTVDQKIVAVGAPGSVNMAGHTINIVSKPFTVTGGAVAPHNVQLGAHQLSIVSHNPQFVVSAGPLPIGETQYPGLVDTSRSLLEAANNKRLMLEADIDTDDLELSVSGDITGWPDAGMLTIDVASGQTLTSSEIAYYDGISDGMIYLTQRGVDGTTALSFSSGARVELRNAARYHNVLAEAIIATQTEVDTKADLGHTHTSEDITDLDTSNLLPLSGGTMTGPLVLASAPTVSMHAATKSYVDSHAGGGGASAQAYGTFWVSEFGASGSAVQTTGSISAFSNSLSVTSADSFEVGQGIYIEGAGAAGAVLISSITAITGTTITIAVNASTTVNNVMVQHDDTVALQTALNQITDIHSLTLMFDNGTYRINGPINATTNSILTIPYDGEFNGGTPRILRMFGQSTPVGNVFWYPSPQGTVIQTNKAGTDSNTSMLNARSPYLGNSFSEMFGQVSLMTVDLRDLTFRTYDNPSISGIDFWMVWNCFLTNIYVDTGMAPAGIDFNNVGMAAEPTHPNFGVRLPRNCTVCISNNLNVANYWYGVIYSDLWVTIHTFVTYCKVGLMTRGHDYTITGTILIVSCPTGFYIEPGNNFGIPSMDIHVRWEVDPRTAPPGPYWWSPIPNQYVYDPGNLLRGRMAWVLIEGYSSTGTHTVTVTGCGNLAMLDLKALL